MDVATYVHRGAADIGLCGLDTMIEADVPLVELIDLELGKCRLCLCGPASDDVAQAQAQVRVVATKFPKLSKQLLRDQGLQVDCVKLHGALEIAPQVGVADAIVDLVETGRTLKENGLVEWCELLQVSARLFTTEATLLQKGDVLNPFVAAMAASEI